MRRWIRSTTLIVGVLCCTLVAAGLASATVLTFDDACSGQCPVSEDYGDRVGDTPNIVVEYNNLGFTKYDTGYGDLLAALGHFSFNVNGEIALRPDPGYLVTLNSFDVAWWAGWVEDQQVLILDEATSSSTVG